MYDNDYEYQQKEYELVWHELRKLTKAEILKGCKVFEDNGMDLYVADKCFVDRIGFHRSLAQTWSTHFHYPEIVFLVCCELLEAM